MRKSLNDIYFDGERFENKYTYNNTFRKKKYKLNYLFNSSTERLRISKGIILILITIITFYLFLVSTLYLLYIII